QRSAVAASNLSSNGQEGSMASVVFMRGVNVGGHRAFQPSVLAADLADLGVVNFGAAGTFVVRQKVAQGALRAGLLRRLPFAAELMICSAGDLLDLASKEPFPDEPSSVDFRRFVSVLAKRPRAIPPLPRCQPEGDQWEVKVVAVTGKFALSYYRRLGRA